MDIEKRMESVVESWKKKGELMTLTLKTDYKMLDTAGGKLPEGCEVLVESIFRNMLFLSIDVAMETMNAEVKKGIMQMDWESDDRPSLYDANHVIGKYLNDCYDSEGELQG